MPLDKIKLPNSFPPAFHAHLRRDEGYFLLYPDLTEVEAKREARRWRTFVKSLRANPSHPSAQLLAGWVARTEVTQQENGLQQLRIQYYPSVGSEILPLLGINPLPTKGSERSHKS